MQGINNSELFFVTALAVNAIPGVDRIVVLNTSINSGARSGILTSLGISLATLAHAIILAFGLFLVLQANEAALEAIRKIGVLFLVALAFYIIIQSVTADSPDASRNKTRASFTLGFVVHFLNPLAILFMISYIPQFITTDGYFPVSFVKLSCLSNAIGLTMNFISAGIAGRLRYWTRSKMVNKGVGIVGGAIILFLAASKLSEFF